MKKPRHWFSKVYNKLDAFALTEFAARELTMGNLAGAARKGLPRRSAEIAKKGGNEFCQDF
jgi:hypothetical protein